MKLADLIRTQKEVDDYGAWSNGDIARASWPMRKKKLKQSKDWQWRVVSLRTPCSRSLRVLLKLNSGIERFYAVLGEVHDDGISVLCSHELHTSHGNWHCHATTKEIEDVFVGVWRDKDSLRRWPDYSGVTTVSFDVDKEVAMTKAANLYRFDLPPQRELAI